MQMLRHDPGSLEAIPGYRILAKIGEGGMGTVYKARQASMDRTVALKVLHPQIAAERDGHERFLREARAIAKLSHPNIVAGIDAGEANGHCFIVMEYLAGESMDAVLKSRGSLPWREAAGIVRQIALALDHAHRNGVIHRDIKPGNIIMLADGTAKLADLGLARLATVDCSLTQSGTIVGSPSYLSPEQAQGTRDIDIRSDFYSLGLTFYEMVSGRCAYPGANPLAVINARLTGDTPLDRLKEIPRDAVAVISKMTRLDPERRYQAPQDLIDDLQALLLGRRPLCATRRRTPRAMTVAAAMLAAALLSLVAGWRFHASAEAPEADSRFVAMAHDARLGILEAVEKARAAAGHGTAIHAELEGGYKNLLYSVDFAQGPRTCNILIDASDGRIIETKVDDEDHTADLADCRTSLAAAVAAALRTHPGTAVEVDLVQPGKGEIAVKIVASGRVVVVTVSGADGTVRSAGTKP